ncbi:MAG: HAD family hydrolase [Candidatus Roizmanbacteria bacterium]|nr:HAD family hydrolase [Candidatus Roizmanbacteria bacterium]
MKKIKAILCDYDGTLVDENGRYLPKVKTLIKKIQDKNVRFSLATGRAYYSPIKRIEKELCIQGIHILHGGAIILNSLENKTLFEQAISQGSSEKIIKHLSSKKMVFSVETKNDAYISHVIKESNFYPEVKNKNIEELDNNGQILKMVIYARANKLNSVESKILFDKLKNDCSDISIMEFEYSGVYGADITSERATKHTAVLEYLKILNLTPDEVVAIGDGPNDYPLFTACGFGIAMATAPKELKEISGLVVNNIVEALEYIDTNLI